MAMTSALGVKAQNASAKPVIIGSAAIDSLWNAIDRYDEIELPPLSVFLAFLNVTEDLLFFLFDPLLIFLKLVQLSMLILH